MAVTRIGGTLLALALLAGCQVPTQVVPLELEPAGTRVFVDGELVAGRPDALTLRSDRPHVVHLERDGHQAQQVVLETRETASGPRLDPPVVRARLAPMVPTERQVTIEGGE